MFYVQCLFFVVVAVVAVVGCLSPVWIMLFFSSWQVSHTPARRYLVPHVLWTLWAFNVAARGCWANEVWKMMACLFVFTCLSFFPTSRSFSTPPSICLSVLLQYFKVGNVSDNMSIYAASFYSALSNLPGNPVWRNNLLASCPSLLWTYLHPSITSLSICV